MQSENVPRIPAVVWLIRAVASGAAGLAVSWAAANLIEASANPVVAVATEAIHLTPGGLARFGEKTFGTNDKLVLVTIVMIVLTVSFGVFGLVAARRPRVPVVGFFVLSAIAAAAILDQPAPGRALVALAAGLATMLLVWTWLTSDPPDAVGRRGLFQVAGVAVVAAAVAGVAPALGRKRRAVEASRSRLTLPGVTPPVVPSGADLGLGQPWMTPAADFYKIDTTITSPAVDPTSWRIRIHGMVDRELTLSLDDLLARQRTQAWVTLCCVSNPVGGSLIGNAWWSGVRIAPLLAEAGVQPGADAVLQTSVDNWTCGTPLAVLTDDRNAMLAVAMNGKPLPIDHGFPVRTVVPGLYGYVSATKWVVDLEVTTMDKAVGYWVPLGWSAEGPVKLMSRIDRPSSGTVPVGDYTFAGVAWEQHTGIAMVEVALDGGPWTKATLARTPGVDTWVQWSATLPVAKGTHTLSVRATDRNGNLQTAVQHDVVPNGATGWDSVQFNAS